MGHGLNWEVKVAFTAAAGTTVMDMLQNKELKAETRVAENNRSKAWQDKSFESKPTCRPKVRHRVAVARFISDVDNQIKCAAIEATEEFEAVTPARDAGPS